MVEFKGKFNKENQERYLKQQFKTLTISMLIWGVIMVAIGVVSLFIDPKDEELVSMAIYLIMFGVMFPLLVVVLSKVSIKAAAKNNKLISDETEQTVVFDEKGVIVSQTKGEEVAVVSKLNYAYIWSVVEKEDCYFIFLARAQVVVALKKEITSGSEKELNKLLAINLKERYKPCAKKQTAKEENLEDRIHD